MGGEINGVENILCHSILRLLIRNKLVFHSENRKKNVLPLVFYWKEKEVLAYSHYELPFPMVRLICSTIHISFVATKIL